VSVIKVRMENFYSDGHQSEEVVDVEAPESLEAETLEGWWQDVVFEHTGDGHAADKPKLGFFYKATVVYVEDLENLKDLAGQTQEWDG